MFVVVFLDDSSDLCRLLLIHLNQIIGARLQEITLGLTGTNSLLYLFSILRALFSFCSDKDHDLPYTNIVDLLDAKGITWKAYQENYPGTFHSFHNLNLFFTILFH